MRTAPTVHVVDDDPAMLASLRRLFSFAGLRVETYTSAEQFLDHCEEAQPGCLVLDVQMPGMSGLELQRVLAARGIDVPVIFLAGSPDIPPAVRAMRQGAVDYLQKPFSNDLLLHLVKKSLKLDAHRQDERLRCRAIKSRFASLTPAERDILDLIVAGHPSSAIARRMGSSVRAVDARRARIMTKMAAGSAAELIHMMLRLDAHDCSAHQEPGRLSGHA